MASEITVDNTQATEQDLNPEDMQGDALTSAKDRFGFFLNDDFHRAQPVSASIQAQRLKKEESRLKKWNVMRNRWQSHFRYRHTRPVTSLSQAEAQKIVAVVSLNNQSNNSSDNNSNSNGSAPSSPSKEGETTQQLQRQTISTQNTHQRQKQRNKQNPQQPKTPSEELLEAFDSEIYFSNVLKRRVRKGVPDTLRGSVWFDFSDAARVQLAYPSPARDIDISQLSRTVLEEIDRDIDRTFPRHVMFIEKDGPGQCSLRRILQWYAALDLEVGYCQGMGFVAALFLTYLPEDQAFYTFYAALTRRSCPLRMMFLPRLVEMQVMLHVIDKLGERLLPQLWQHFSNEGVHVTMFFTEWAMAFFCRGFSFELVTRIWDVLLFEGRLKMVYRASLAILHSVQHELLALKFEKVLGFLRDLPNRIDSQGVVDQCWKLPLKTAHITEAEEEYWAQKTAGRGI